MGIDFLSAKNAENAFNSIQIDFILCTITVDIKMVQGKRKEVLPMMKNTKKLHATPLSATQETGMMCTISRESLFMFTKHAWIGDPCASCHITNDDTGMYDITTINKSVQGSKEEGN